eukprot:GILJ01015865.1.p2 GENE.GILJ01015865.1~~GILJ01015865.1.p2  ORF type:complete len:411 (-),score=64.81 GILJ01015865.1:2596-3828(-)
MDVSDDMLLFGSGAAGQVLGDAMAAAAAAAADSTSASKGAPKKGSAKSMADSSKSANAKSGENASGARAQALSSKTRLISEDDEDDIVGESAAFDAFVTSFSKHGFSKEILWEMFSSRQREKVARKRERERDERIDFERAEERAMALEERAIAREENNEVLRKIVEVVAVAADKKVPDKDEKAEREKKVSAITYTPLSLGGGKSIGWVCVSVICNEAPEEDRSTIFNKRFEEAMRAIYPGIFVPSPDSRFRHHAVEVHLLRQEGDHLIKLYRSDKEWYLSAHQWMKLFLGTALAIKRSSLTLDCAQLISYEFQEVTFPDAGDNVAGTANFFSLVYDRVDTNFDKYIADIDKKRLSADVKFNRGHAPPLAKSATGASAAAKASIAAAEIPPSDVPPTSSRKSGGVTVAGSH